MIFRWSNSYWQTSYYRLLVVREVSRLKFLLSENIKHLDLAQAGLRDFNPGALQLTKTQSTDAVSESLPKFADLRLHYRLP